MDFYAEMHGIDEDWLFYGSRDLPKEIAKLGRTIKRTLIVAPPLMVALMIMAIIAFHQVIIERNGLDSFEQSMVAVIAFIPATLCALFGSVILTDATKRRKSLTGMQKKLEKRAS